LVGEDTKQFTDIVTSSSNLRPSPTFHSWSIRSGEEKGSRCVFYILLEKDAIELKKI
jgi:hypothetical protein